MAKTNGVTFQVDDVQAYAKGTLNDKDTNKSIYKKPIVWLKYGDKECANKYELETMATVPETVALSFFSHGFFKTVWESFNQHWSLSIKPDHVWQTILEGFSQHVNKHAKELRSVFVAHEDKKTLSVRHDLLKRKCADHWPEVFEEFGKQIKANIKDSDFFHVATDDFSTSSPLDSVARHISLMSITKEYFDLSASTMCGIPTITLQGSKQDWENMLKRILLLQPFMMEDFGNTWVPLLCEIVVECIAAFEGKQDKLFWSSICKYNSTQGSGASTYITGWIRNLYPYLGSDMHANQYLQPWKTMKKTIADGHFEGPKYQEFCLHFCEAPVEWNFFGTKIQLLFKTGFVGCEQVVDDQGNVCVTPHVSWAILNEKTSTLKEEQVLKKINTT